MVEVKLHDIGEGISEGEIIHFFVKEGDTVTIDQPLLEVQTDKVTAELPSPVAGIVKEIKASEGDVIEVGTTVVLIEKEGSEPTENKQQNDQSNIPAESTAITNEASHTKTYYISDQEAVGRLSNRVIATPYTRKIAREHNVDIEQVTGTGPAGRVMDEDVYRFIEGAKSPAKSESETITVKEKLVAKRNTTTVTEIPFKGRRKQIAAKMSQSMYTIPHVTHFEEIDLTNLFEIKKALKQSDPTGEKGQNVSLAAFFIKALQLALQEYPIFNSKLDEEKEVIRVEEAVSIGIATDSDEGLIVPVMKNVQEKPIKTIHKEMKELIQRARENQLKPSDLTGGTFTISNVGPMGSTGATPIINYPEVGLMAFHKTKKMPVVIEDEIVIRQMMNVSMTFDHRITDGATAVAFTNCFKHYLETPALLTLELV